MGTDKATRMDNTLTWLELEAIKLGTISQQERWRLDMLPEDELAALAREELFRPFEAFERWDRKHWVRPSHVKHAAHCPQPKNVEFEITDAGDLDQARFETFTLLRHAIHEAMNHPWCDTGQLAWGIVARAHWATCKSCEAEAVRYSATVSVQWAGRTLSREYLL